MTVPGAYFEVTGSMAELDRIFDGIARSDGRLTADGSASLDLWLEMKDEWFAKHDAVIVDQIETILNDKNQYEYEGLSWNGVEALRKITGIKAPKGAWLA